MTASTQSGDGTTSDVSKKRIAPSKSGQEGVPRRCCSDSRQPPTRRPTPCPAFSHAHPGDACIARGRDRSARGAQSRSSSVHSGAGRIVPGGSARPRVRCKERAEMEARHAKPRSTIPPDEPVRQARQSPESGRAALRNRRPLRTHVVSSAREHSSRWPTRWVVRLLAGPPTPSRASRSSSRRRRSRGSGGPPSRWPRRGRARPRWSARPSGRGASAGVRPPHHWHRTTRLCARRAGDRVAPLRRALWARP